MAYLIYDGSFEGFLSVVFTCYQAKITPTDICKKNTFQGILFADKQTISTDEQKASRVGMPCSENFISETGIYLL